ncbi:hypothetical protein J7M23_12870 [Candidatus Sumerlaeota bacterium]|nr:hypothetical protein [Candidatus Sumerlaeota bacterium]
MAIVEGKLVQLLDYQPTGNVYNDGFIVPGAGGRFGDYVARLDYVPDPGYGVTIAGTPAGGGSGFVEVEYMPTQSGDYYVDYCRGDVYFHSSDEGSEVTASYKPRGSLIQATHLQTIQQVVCVPFFLLGRMDTATQNGDYFLKIPLDGGDEPTIYVQGISVIAQVWSGDNVIGNTTIRVANAVYDPAQTDKIDVTLTNTQSEETDRVNSAIGLFSVNIDTQALYIHIHEAGGHENIFGWIWFRRNQS